MDITFTVTLPDEVGTQASALVAKIEDTLDKIDAAATSLAGSVSALQASLDTLAASVTTAVPAIQGDVKEVADAIKSFKLSGPLGFHGGSTGGST
jgi:uncharacterized protein YlxW (UPF0749 family)